MTDKFVCAEISIKWDPPSSTFFFSYTQSFQTTTYTKHYSQIIITMYKILFNSSTTTYIKHYSQIIITIYKILFNTSFKHPNLSIPILLTNSIKIP